VRFVWDGLRLLQEIAEPEHGPVETRTWVYDPADPAGYVPLACCDRRHGADPGAPPSPAEVHYVHTDALGTPLELTDATGKIAWSACYGAWGRRLGAAAVAPALHATLPTDCHLRFPGQYADAETGLHYNTFRYYDPDTGRFVSPDPIGLAGGFNLYRYAPNPTGWSDPWGWCSNSKQLGKNMENAGRPRPANTAAHHIVPDSATRAKGILQKFGINIDDAVNGVFLPTTKNLSGSPGILHSGMHPNSYIAKVTSAIERAAQQGGKQEILDTLQSLGTTLQNSARNANWRTVRP
jgi:RHS repeat-associated protein